MKNKYPEGKGKKQITISIDKVLEKEFDEYLKNNGLYNKSSVVENLIKKQIEEDKNKNNLNI
jgi:metal-responsive CopG/Arc/MetJ family transcriptional regulator